MINQGIEYSETQLLWLVDSYSFYRRNVPEYAKPKILIDYGVVEDDQAVHGAADQPLGYADAQL